MIEFLIDECLTPELVVVAKGAGYEANHVLWLGRAGAPDWSVARLAVATAACVVTNNRRDFLKLFGRSDIHPGLIIVDPAETQARQIALFKRILAALEGYDDLIDRLIEPGMSGEIRITPWPARTP